MITLLLVACSRPVPFEDNSLEASAASSGNDTLEAEGTASVAPGADDGDWVLTVGGTAFDWHSASRAPLSELDGRDLRVEIDEVFSTVGGARILEAGVPVLVTSVGDGSVAFDRELFVHGEAIGRGEIVNDYDEATNVVFHEAVVHGDDGDVVLLPGEPTPVVIDGVTYRTTVLASYRIDRRPNEPMPQCGPSDLMMVELFRLDASEEEAPLVRPIDRRAPLSSCG